ncbi:hypothetical protein [uncultured Phenylobacterium sp.]|uniref:hypothetical protein n=1 Tax=uncultured Phenylobacterium sp. TaxID=349273 RepID=UPI0025FD6780|nr:hypothetical protein [uncultured Phenylobacterium sp.]
MRRAPFLALGAIAALAGQQAKAAPAQGPVAVARPLTIDDILDRACGPMQTASVALAARDASAQEQPGPEVTASPADAPPQDAAPLDGRRRPGRVEEFPAPIRQENPGAVRAPPPEAFPKDEIPVPDRWRLAGALGVSRPRLIDPYNQNFLKGDLPIKGTEDWFLNVSLISDTVFEPRSFPIPVGVQTTERAGSLDVFGKDTSLVFAQTFIAAASLVKGSTAYKPPEYEFRVAVAGQYNYVDVPERRVLNVKPSKPSHRNDAFIGLQEAFLDYHLRNIGERYDFDSIRVGIQPFNTDFRGFLFQDNQLGVRLFGNRDNNRFQYNLAVFRRIEKDTNSGLNDVGQKLREDYVFIANVFRQDLPIPGLTSQLTVVHNRNHEGDDIQIDHNGFPVRPALIGNLKGRNYEVTYLGYNADGHWGRVNLTASAYYAYGQDRNSIFTDRKAKIRSYFVAVEPSIDFSWVRVRLNGLYASGDKNPYDNTERGFDAIQENPQFVGSDTSYWIRQTIPFAGGGRVIGVNGRNGLLNSLRSSKDEGQSNFNNPGTVIFGAGADFDVTPELRITTNLNHFGFANTATVQALRQEGSIPKSLGWDASVSAIWRPFMTQNIVVRLSGAAFDPGKGFKDLFANAERNKRYYSVLANIIFTY